MARESMVTRTIKSTKVNILCLNVSSGEPFNELVTVSRTYKDNEALLKKVKETVETDTVKAVHIVDSEVVENLYGMTEADFITYGKVLPSRNTAEAEE